MKNIDHDAAEFFKRMAKEGLDITLEDLRSPHRYSSYVFRRALFVKFMRDRQYSLTEIGNFMNRCHATVINLLKYAEKDQCRNKDYHDIVSRMPHGDIESQILFHQTEITKLKALLQTKTETPMTEEDTLPTSSTKALYVVHKHEDRPYPQAMYDVGLFFEGEEVSGGPTLAHFYVEKDANDFCRMKNRELEDEGN